MYNKQQWEDLKIYSSKTHTDHPPPEIPWRSLETNQVSAHAAAAAADLIYPSLSDVLSRLPKSSFHP